MELWGSARRAVGIGPCVAAPPQRPVPRTGRTLMVYKRDFIAALLPGHSQGPARITRASATLALLSRPRCSEKTRMKTARGPARDSVRADDLQAGAHTRPGTTALPAAKSRCPVPLHTGSLGATGVSGLPAAGTRNRPVTPSVGREAVAGPRGWDRLDALDNMKENNS